MSQVCHNNSQSSAHHHFSFNPQFPSNHSESIPVTPNTPPQPPRRSGRSRCAPEVWRHNWFKVQQPDPQNVDHAAYREPTPAVPSSESDSDASHSSGSESEVNSEESE